MTNKLILSESSYDYKYSNIYSRIDGVEVIEGGFIKLLGLLATRKCYYHIRYVKYRGYLGTMLRLILIFMTAKLSGSKIIWTCHNIYEHNISSRKYNDLIRKFICKISHDIIVFHEDLIEFLPKKCRTKIRVATFGDFKLFVEKQVEENPDFSNKYSNWLNENKAECPDVVSISTAKRNNLPVLVTQSKRMKYKVLIIAPGVNLEFEPFSKNLLFYNDSFVKKEIFNILTNSKELVGFIGHDNISVPTSLYMYASFGIPVIVLDSKPSNSIVTKHQIGKVIKESRELSAIIAEVKMNYAYYKRNCEIFMNSSSWKNSAAIHSSIFK